MLKIEDIKISKELIEVIMDTKFQKNTSIDDILLINASSTETILSYPRDCGCCRESINLYQFIDKCKNGL
ncbi:hypothetical protein [Aliarcobacter lanthieri]|uniref:hypothetical protein n=1 Tax=Aliarcobacter lanthieri TaxID=1355374 RepID=UPI00047C1079|nr:hypothetical protein [Aliarcobacter lanthieri]QKF59251.1 hypothetical protein ALANTH_1142 [Aliarcobacter lanthieri]